MASYFWAPDSAHLLFDSNGRLWLYDLHNGIGVQMGFTGTRFRRRSQVLARRHLNISFIRDHAPGRHPTARSRHAHRRFAACAQSAQTATSQSMLNGEVDWVYEEELDVRSNYFWSPDSKNLAYLQMNETQVPQYPLTDWIPTHAQVEWQRYPQPGDPIPKCAWAW